MAPAEPAGWEAAGIRAEKHATEELVKGPRKTWCSGKVAGVAAVQI